MSRLAVRINHDSKCCKTFLPPHSQRRLKIPHKIVLKCVFIFIHNFHGWVHMGPRGCACFPAGREIADACAQEKGCWDPCVCPGRMGWSSGHAGPDQTAKVTNLSPPTYMCKPHHYYYYYYYYLQINLIFRKTSKALSGEHLQRCLQDEQGVQGSLWLPSVAWCTSSSSLPEVHMGLFTSAALFSIIIGSQLSPLSLFLN